MTEYVFRFLIGGAVVSAFSMLGDLLRPKSFAGLFGAAPSVAFATLGIAIYQQGRILCSIAESLDDGRRRRARALQHRRLPTA